MPPLRRRRSKSNVASYHLLTTLKVGNAASATSIFLGGSTDKPNGYAVAFVVPVLGVIVVAAVGDVAVDDAVGDVAVDDAVAVDLDVVAVGASVADAVACGMAADPIDDVDYDKTMTIYIMIILFAGQVSHRMGAMFGTPQRKAQ